MKSNRVILLTILTSLVAVATASDPNELIRAKSDLQKTLKPTKTQSIDMGKIDAKYFKQLEKLRKDKPADYMIQRDALNEKYTREFMAALTPIQKSDYRKYIRGLRQGYIKKHAEVDADNIFIWGGADIL